MFAALAVAWLIEQRTAWSIKKFVAPCAATGTICARARVTISRSADRVAGQRARSAP
jgi:hypothetical protein